MHIIVFFCKVWHIEKCKESQKKFIVLWQRTLSHAGCWTKASLCKGVYAFTFSLLSLSPIPTFIPLSSDLPANNRNPFIFHLSTFPLSLSLSLRPPSLTIILSLCLLPRVSFSNQHRTHLFLFGVSLLFFSRLTDCRDEEGRKEWERGGEGGGDVSLGLQDRFLFYEERLVFGAWSGL